MKIKRIITGAVALSMLCCSSVLADSSQRKEVVNFNIEVENGGELTAVITKSNESTIRWMGIVNADESGDVNFNVELEDYYDNELSDGAYTLTLIGKNKYEKYQENFSYKSTPTREQVLQGITDEASVIALFTNPDVREELNAMGLYVDEFSALGDEQAKVASKVIALSEKTEKSMSDEIGPYIIYLKCIKDGNEKFAENFNKYAEECFGVNIDSELYKKLLTEKDEKALYEHIKELGDSATGKLKADFEDVLVTALFNSTIDGGEMQRIISTYGEYAGFDMTKYNNAADKQAFAIHMINEYNNSSDVKSRYNSYTPSSTSNKPIGGGSSGGGGGGSKPVSNGAGGGISISTSGSGKPYVEYTPVQSLEEKYSFKDMSSYEWANEAVVQLAAKGIISGVGDNMFAPGREITREEFAKLVSLAFDVKDVGNSAFTDVESSRWSYSAISALASAGIIGGIGDGMFAPERFITRQDMAVIIDRALTKKAIVIELQKKEDFSDISDVSDYAKESVAGLYQRGLVSGTGDGNYKPLNYVTRAEAAQILYNCLKAIGGEN